MKKILSFLSLCSLFSFPAWSETETLTVYTYDSFASEWGPGPQIKKAFEAQCDCSLNLVALDDGVSILNRLRLEGQSTQADVVLGLDDSLIEEAKKTGLLAQNQVDLSDLSLPMEWKDNVFVPYDYGYFAFIYNKEKLKTPPKSLRALVEDDNDLKIIYQDPRTSTPGQGLLLWMKSVFGNDTEHAWKALAKKTVTVTKGWSEAYSMFLNGESDMVLSYTTSPAYHEVVEHKHQYAAARFSEGHYLQVEVAARVKTSTHPKIANQFLQFLLSNQVQNIIPTTNWMYPVKAVSLPEAFDSHNIPHQVLHFDSDTVSKNRRQWIRSWQSALTF